MRVIVSLILVIALGINDDGSKKGREGNELYRDAAHEMAASLFTAGINEQNSSEPGAVHSGLWNNLGASLFRMGRFDEASQAFVNAVALAPSEREVARSSYNAGNNAFEAYQKSSQQMGGGPQGGVPQGGGNQAAQAMGQQAGGAAAGGLQGALEYYKQSMLADPANEDAKFNYEFVKRQLDEQQQNQDQQQQQDQQNQDQQQQQQPPPDPNKLSKEEAERILQALQNDEEELLRQVMKSQSRPKKVEKDW